MVGCWCRVVFDVFVYMNMQLYEVSYKPILCAILQGFAIGNGLTQPDIQYQAYADYALDMALIDETDYNRLSKLYPACLTAIKLCGNSPVTNVVLIR